jgi:general secretion pathway protein N
LTARRALRIAAWIAALLFTAAATVVVRAPAAWLGDWMQASGKLRLIDAQGTLWEGSAMLAISDGRKAMLLPGRVSWQVRPWTILAGRLQASLSHRALQAPLALTIGRDGVSLTAGRAELPAAVLVAVGAPFSTVRPGGTIGFRWSELELRRTLFAGSIQVDWRDARSALSTVAPLGSYQLTITGAGDSARVQLDTLRGPLRLQGNGSLKAGHLSFRGTASADPEMRQALNGLLGLLGQRSGDNVALVLDT